MDLTFDHPKELRKKRIRCGRIGSCHQDIDVPGFLLLCGNAFFQIPGRLVGHIIHLDSCFPYLIPESGNRTFIIGIIQNSGNRRRWNPCLFCDLLDGHVPVPSLWKKSTRYQSCKLLNVIYVTQHHQCNRTFYHSLFHSN